MAPAQKQFPDVKLQYRTRASDGGNLYLIISKADTRSWMVRVTLDGKVVDCGIGSIHDVSLEQARKVASDYRQLAKQGIDPRTGLAPNGAGPKTFAEAFEAFAADKGHELTSAQALDRWHVVNRKYLGSLASVPVGEVNAQHVLKALKPVWTDVPSQGPFAASLVRRVLAYAAANGDRDPNLANPADWENSLQYLLPKPAKSKHSPAMPYKDVPGFVAELRKSDKVQARALEFLILTATRKAETLGATWDEIDFSACTWTIPAERMKNRKEHVVPLTKRALEILRLQQASKHADASNSYVFVGIKANRPIAPNTLLRWVPEKYTVHGFRASITQFLSDKTDASFETVEQVLSHAVGNSVTQAYRRQASLEKMGAALKLWSDFIG
jgi:integrase